jgi:type II secretory pathway pseudopilin PulG
MNRQGMTTIELLIASAILMVILGVVVQGLQSGGNVVSGVINDAELLEDIRVAAQMMSDEVARAVYVYPPGATIMLNKSVSWMVKNPRTKNNKWTIGQDPIVAFLEAPKRTGETCSDASEISKEACIYFVAFYMLPRAEVVKSRTYLQDPLNNSAWMLFEYRRRLDLKTLNADTVLPLGPNNGLINGIAEMVADYIVPGKFMLVDTICRKRFSEAEVGETGSHVCTEFTQAFDPYYLKTMLSATLSLSASVTRGKQVIRTPEISFSLSPRNLY